MRSPIGVFDSGLGGLTVLKELVRELPSEDFVYLGDVARLPYGSKSKAVIERYARSCAQFLVKKKVKWIVIACNTASAMALDAIRAEFSIGVVGVIDPAVRAAVAATKTKEVLVIATSSTVKSEAYSKEFHRCNSSVHVQEIACPLFVPLAEEGWFDSPVARQVAREYLARVTLKNYDVLLLGCTHYPLLRPSLEAVLPQEVQLVHSGENVAKDLRNALHAAGLQAGPGVGTLEFFTTDVLPAGLPMLHSLFGRQIQFEVVDL